MVKAAVCKTVLGLFLSWVRFPPGSPNSDVAQWIEHQITDLGVAGSSPAIRAKTIKYLMSEMRAFIPVIGR